MMAQPKAVLWDLDGVIVDTAPFHFAAWQAAFASRGVSFTQEDFCRSFGQRNEFIIPHILGHEIPKSEMEEFSRKKEEDFRVRARQGLALFPGVRELLEQLRERGFRQAVASSTPRDNINLLFPLFGIGQFFEAVISAEDVRRGKPDPEVFLLAAARLSVPADRCVVIEDAVAGVAAAKAAGAKCLAVTNTNSREKLAKADLVVDSLTEVFWKTMDRLISGCVD